MPKKKLKLLCFHGQGLYLCNFESHACLWTTEGRITVFLKHGECAVPHLRRAATLRRTVDPNEYISPKIGNFMIFVVARVIVIKTRTKNLSTP